MSAIYIGLALLIIGAILLGLALYEICQEEDISAYEARKQIVQKPQAPGIKRIKVG